MKSNVENKKFLKNWVEINRLFNNKLKVTRIVNNNLKDDFGSDLKKRKLNCKRNNKSLLKLYKRLSNQNNTNHEINQFCNCGIDMVKEKSFNLCLYFIYSCFYVIENLKMVVLLSDKQPIKYINQIENQVLEFKEKTNEVLIQINQQIQFISIFINENNNNIYNNINNLNNNSYDDNDNIINKSSGSFNNINGIYGKKKKKVLIKNSCFKVKRILQLNLNYWSNLLKEITIIERNFNNLKMDLSNLNYINHIGLHLLTIVHQNYYSINYRIKKEIKKNNVIKSEIGENKEFKRIIVRSFELFEYLINRENKIN
ncbi:hypothetical protein ACTFIV_002814 [Dictyostelium citrinum]